MQMATFKLVALAASMLLAASMSKADERMMPYIDWLIANTDYEYNGEELPTVKHMSEQMLMIYGYGEQRVAQAEFKGSYLAPILGLYDDEENVIMLPDTHDLMDFEIGHIVVHELVHYLQTINGFDDHGCKQNSEPEAYRLHEQWMDEHDHPADRPNALWVMMIATACHRYDYLAPYTAH